MSHTVADMCKLNISKMFCTMLIRLKNANPNSGLN